MDKRGHVLQNTFSSIQSKIEFEDFYERLMTLKKKHKKQEILVNFEPADHYWMNLTAFLTHYGILFVKVNPMQVNRSKELGDNLQQQIEASIARRH